MLMLIVCNANFMLMLIVCNANFMLIYVNITDRFNFCLWEDF